MYGITLDVYTVGLHGADGVLGSYLPGGSARA